MVLVEAGIFSSDDGVLEVGRDLRERNEAIALVIRNAVDQRLEVSLHVERGCWRIDPAESDEAEDRERPRKRKGDHEPQQNGAEPDGPEQWLRSETAAGRGECGGH